LKTDLKKNHGNNKKQCISVISSEESKGGRGQNRSYEILSLHLGPIGIPVSGKERCTVQQAGMKDYSFKTMKCRRRLSNEDTMCLIKEDVGKKKSKVLILIMVCPTMCTALNQSHEK
jgi:hypothetical protein